MFVLGVLIFIHELGHFSVAKLVGVRVEKFSLGFGKKLLGFKSGDTEYLLCILPFGGYVKMAGDEPGEERENKPYEFLSKSVKERAAIVLAGPIMNIVLAIVLMVLPYSMGVAVEKYRVQEVKVSWLDSNSIAAGAGVRIGDVVTGINGQKVSTWNAFYAALDSVKDVKTIDVFRDGINTTLSVPKDKTSDGVHMTFGIQPMVEPRVGVLQEGMPAVEAGLKVKDLIVAVDGVSIKHWNQLSKMISSRGGTEAILTVDRGGRVFEVPIKPKFDKKAERGLIGITPFRDMTNVRYSFIESAKKGFGDFTHLTYLTFDFLKKLVQGKDEAVKNLGGPIRIYQVTGAVAKTGFTYLLKFMGFLSLQLGILNLMPIPVLDGGHLFFYALEAVRKKQLAYKKQEFVQNIGMILLLLMMIIVTYNDIVEIFFK